MAENYVLGVDVGTSNFTVAVVVDGHAEVLMNDIGGRSTPSCVFADLLRPPDEWEVGLAAVRAGNVNPMHCITNSKCLLGLTSSEYISAENLVKLQNLDIEENVHGQLAISIGGVSSVTASEVTTRFLKEISTIALTYLGHSVRRGVITVPNYFLERQIEEFRDSAYIAGFEELQIVRDTSASAAMYAYRNAEKDQEETVVIIDVGGGGGSLAVCKVANGKVHVHARSTDKLPGGEEFSRRLLDYVLQEVKKAHGADITDIYSLSILRQQCSIAKEKLSRIPNATIKCFLPCIGRECHVDVMRSSFESVCSDLLDLMSNQIREVLHNSKVRK